MKKVILLIVMLVLYTSSAFSQDVVVKDSTTMQSKNSEVVTRGISQKEWDYSKMMRENYLSAAKGWGIAGTVFFWTNAAIGTTWAFLNNDYDYHFAIIMGSFLANGALGAFIFNEIGRSFERKANEILVSNTIIKQDFKVGNKHIVAGLNVFNNKISKEKTLALMIGLNI